MLKNLLKMDCRAFFENKSIKWLVFLIAILYSVYEYAWGLWIIDNYYWINISSHWQESPMTLLSLWTMNEWYELFGRTLIAQRALAWGINTMTVLLAYMFFVSKEQCWKYWYFLCGALVVMGPGIAKTCTPDCHSSLLVLFLLWCALKNKHINIGWLIAMSIISALVIAARFPNIVCIPFVMLYLIFSTENKKKGMALAIGYMCLSMIIYWGGMAMAMGTTGVLGEIGKTFQHATGGSNGRHSMIGLLLRYGKSILLSIGALVIILGAWLTNKKMMWRHTLLKYLLITIISTILLYLIFVNVVPRWHSWSVSLASIVALALLYCVYQEWKQRNIKEAWRLILITTLIFVPSAGSDTGFMKSMILACALMPYAISSLVQHRVEMSNIAMSFVIIMLTSIQIFNERAIHNSHISDIGPNKYVMLEKWQANMYEQLISSIEPYYKKDSTMFYGLDAHFLYCATNTDVPYTTFWMEHNDTIEINRVAEAFIQSHKNVLIDLTKSDTILFTSKGLQLQAEDAGFNVYSIFDETKK